MKVSRATTRRCFSASAKHIPIAIVGGGPAGLFLSNLLSTYNTPSILLGARSSKQLCAHPQAHFLNTRTMEIMRHALPNLYTTASAKPCLPSKNGATLILGIRLPAKWRGWYTRSTDLYRRIGMPTAHCSPSVRYAGNQHPSDGLPLLAVVVAEVAPLRTTNNRR